MTIIPTQFSAYTQNPIIPLALYAQLTGHTECQFFGLDDGGANRFECRRYWTKAQRDLVTWYLNEAQSKLENILHFTLTEEWKADEQHYYKPSYHTQWANIIEPGILAWTNIALGETVNYAADVGTIGPVATTVTDEDEIMIFYPGTDSEINPDSVVIAGGNVTITVPQCRMLDPVNMTNAENEGIDYTDPTMFLATVDVKRRYTDPSTQAILYKYADCQSAPCAEETETGCILILNPNTGYVKVTPSTYTNSTWTKLSSCSAYTKVLLNYKTGWLPDNVDPVIPLMQLAHSLMPESPCGCNWVRQYWGEAHRSPEILTRERINSPLGIWDGSWMAYKWALSNRILRGSIL